MPLPCAPLHVETFGRDEKTSLKHIRKLARKQAEKLEEGAEDAMGLLVERWAAASAWRCTAPTARTSAAPWVSLT